MMNHWLSCQWKEWFCKIQRQWPKSSTWTNIVINIFIQNSTKGITENCKSQIRNTLKVIFHPKRSNFDSNYNNFIQKQTPYLSMAKKEHMISIGLNKEGLNIPLVGPPTMITATTFSSELTIILTITKTQISQKWHWDTNWYVKALWFSRMGL